MLGTAVEDVKVPRILSVRGPPREGYACQYLTPLPTWDISQVTSPSDAGAPQAKF